MTIDQYKFERALQESSVNATLLGTDADGRKIVVRKLLRELVSTGWVLRMEHEAKRLKEIECASYAAPIDFGVADQWIYTAYRWYDAIPISSLLALDAQSRRLEGVQVSTGPLAPDRRLISTLQIAAAVLKSLNAVHQTGYVHRDIRPTHILFSGDVSASTTSVADWILAGYGPICVAEGFGSNGPDAQEFASFASPELAGSIDHDLSPASDLYSLGLVLYTCLMGKPPFVGDDVGEILFKHLTETPNFDGLGKEVPNVVEQFITRLLEKEVRDRYQSAASALLDVESILESLHTGVSTDVIIGRHDMRTELTEPSFVGRAEEMAAIDAHLDAVAANEFRSLIAIGKSGMGKSRLLLEAIRAATRRGFTIYRSVASDQATQAPLGPVLNVIDGLARNIGFDAALTEIAKEALGEYRGEVATAMPALARSLGWDNLSLAGPEELGQGRIIAAFCAVLKLCSSTGPTLLCFDDCQWLDKSSLRVLEEFAKGKPANTFLLVGSRPNEGMSEEVLTSLSDASSLEFGELDDAGIHALVESMAGLLPQNIKDSVARMAFGSPFLATAAMRGLVESKALVASANAWKVDEERLADFQAAGDSANVLLKRLKFVQADAAELMATGAVIGKQFDLEIPLTLTGIPFEQAFSALQSARDQGLVWTKPDGVIAFVHDKIREAVVSTIADDKRSELHRQVAEYLLERKPDSCFDLAHHFDAAALPMRAWPHALRAAKVARSRYALESAETQYRIASRAIDHVDGKSIASVNVAEAEAIDPNSQYELESGLAEVLLLLGKYEEAETWLGRALSSAYSPIEEAKIGLKQGDLAFKRGDKEQALDRFEQALVDAGEFVPKTNFQLVRCLVRELGVQVLHSVAAKWFVARKSEQPAESDLLTWRLYSKLAHCYWYVRDKNFTLWSHLRELNAAEIYPPTLELAQAYSEHAPVMSLIPWQRRGLDYARRSLAIREAAEDLWGQGQSRNFLSIMFYAGARYEECMNQAQQAISVLERTGDYWEVHMAQYQAAASLYRLGRLKEAADSARTLYQSAIQRGDHQASGNALDLWSRASLGRVPESIMQEETTEERHDHQGRCQMFLAEGVQHHMAGDFDKSIACFQRAVDAVRQTGVLNAYITPNYAWLATSKRRRYETQTPLTLRKRRAALYELLRAAKAAVRVAWRFRGEMPHALRELAAAEAMFGRVNRAIKLLKRSIKVATSQKATYEVAQSNLLLARIMADIADETADKEAIHLRELEKTLQEFEASVEHVASEASLSLIDRFEVLLDAGRQITASISTDDVILRTFEAAQRLLRGERTLVAEEQRSEDGQPQYVVLQPSRATVDFDADIICEAAKRDTTIIQNQEQVDRHGIITKQAGAFLCCPIKVHNETQFYLYVANTRLANVFGDDELRIASYLASAASGALERADGFKQLETLNESLENRVAERTEAVVQRSRELEATANELRATQAELEAAKDFAEKASESKSRFLACMSHEIRTPMSAVLGFTEILQTRNVSKAERRKYLSRIHTNGKHLLTLLNDLLDFSKIEAGKLEVEHIACRPFELISGAVSAFQSRADEKQLNLRVEIDGSIPESITTDPTRLRQIVMNLVGNAIKFTDAGEILVCLAYVPPTEMPTQDGTSGEGQLRITVQDTGIGISSSQASKLFAPFTQADSSTTRQFGGTGLGLSISKKLAEALGGDISVTSQLGEGSAFTVNIDTGPMADVAFVDASQVDADREDETETPCNATTDLAGRSFLVVDDVEANRELIGYLLRESGGQVHFAVNGQDALDKIADNPTFNVVFMDMQMPVMDGFAAARALRSQGSKLPIVAMTANTMQGDRELCLDAGCTDYIAKPIQFADLLSKASDLSRNGKNLNRQVATSGDEEQITIATPEHKSSPESLSEASTKITSDDLDMAAALDKFGRDFLSEVEQRWDEIELAVREERYEQLGELAHWIKGTGGTFGYDCIAQTMEDIEDVIRKDQTDAVEPLFAEFSDRFQQLVTSAPS